MRTRRATILALCLIAPGCGAPLPNDAAEALIASIQREERMEIPIGSLIFWRPGSSFGNNNPHDHAIAFNKIGVVKIEDCRPYLGTHRVCGVSLSEKPDGKRIVADGNRLHLLMQDYSGARAEVLKAERVIGGSTKWDGTLAYMEVTNIKPAQLYLEYRHVRNETQTTTPTSFSRRYRALFRKSKFDGQWSLLAWDSARNGTSFASDNVVARLLAD